MSEDVVLYESSNHVGLITLNRPQARNAVNGDLAEGVEAAMDHIENDPDIWITIITGNGPSFCAGADLKAVSSGDAGRLSTKRGGFAGLVMRERTKPLIAACDGPALAGGTEIVLSCDLVVASTAARFGVPEVKRSLAAAAGGLFRLPKVLPRNVATELILTGDPISAEMAAHYGMVNTLCEPGEALATARELAERIAVNAPLAVRESLAVMKASVGLDDEAAMKLSGQAMRRLSETADYAEGPRAFIEKRAPVWQGK